MEKQDSESKRKLVIFLTISICIILLTSTLSVLFLLQLDYNTRCYKDLVKDNKEMPIETKQYKEKIITLDKEIEEYKNIDQAIINAKADYFKAIKEVEDQILAGTSNRKIAYLTFDDGPYFNTYKVLDILDQAGVKATFFTTNINGEYCYDNKGMNCHVMYQEYIKRGHTIANHTFTHAIRRGLYNSVDSFMDAVVKQEELIKNYTGYTTNILRFPGGSPTAKGLKDGIIARLRERGYGYVDWTAGDGDGGGLYSVDQAWDNLYKTIDSNIEVVLFHDYNGITTAILPDFINYLRTNGYEIYPLFYESNMIKK